MHTTLILAWLAGCSTDPGSPTDEEEATPTPTDATSETCTPDCDGRRCGDDGCGGTCGTCRDGRSCTDAGTCEDDCGPNATPDGATCVCDPGYLADPQCETCVEDTDGDGCPEDAYPGADGCYCVAGYDVNAAGCGCEPHGFIASPCTADADCHPELFLNWPICAYDLSEFSTGSSPEPLAGPMPGGYCSTRVCAYCTEYGGTCAEMGSSLFGDIAQACLFACNSGAQCRDGYTCRPISPDEHWDAPLASFCLPPL